MTCTKFLLRLARRTALCAVVAAGAVVIGPGPAQAVTYPPTLGKINPPDPNVEESNETWEAVAFYSSHNGTTFSVSSTCPGSFSSPSTTVYSGSGPSFGDPNPYPGTISFSGSFSGTLSLDPERQDYRFTPTSAEMGFVIDSSIGRVTGTATGPATTSVLYGDRVRNFGTCHADGGSAHVTLAYEAEITTTEGRFRDRGIALVTAFHRTSSLPVPHLVSVEFLSDLVQPALVPTEAKSVSDVVQELFSEGALTQGEAKSLVSKIAAGQAQEDKGNTTAALNVYAAILEQIEALVGANRLTEAEAQPLLDAVEREITRLRAST